MGIVLDSSVTIAAERRGHTVREILEQVKAVQGEIEIGLSVVTIAELWRLVGAVREPPKRIAMPLHWLPQSGLIKRLPSL